MENQSQDNELSHVMDSFREKLRKRIHATLGYIDNRTVYVLVSEIEELIGIKGVNTNEKRSDFERYIIVRLMCKDLQVKLNKSMQKVKFLEKKLKRHGIF